MKVYWGSGGIAPLTKEPVSDVPGTYRFGNNFLFSNMKPNYAIMLRPGCSRVCFPPIF
jgi:hypothetical protein